MKTDLTITNLLPSTSLGKAFSLEGFGTLVNAAENLQGFLIEMEKTEQVKLQANAFMHHSDNQKEIALRGFDSKDLEIRAAMRRSEQNHIETMCELQKNATIQLGVLKMSNELINQGQFQKGLELLKSIILKETYNDRKNSNGN